MKITEPAFLLPLAFDYGATFLFAVAGALLAARRGYDAVGMLVVAMVSSTGGGLLRDGFFLQSGPPAMLQSNVYLFLIATAVALVWLIGKHLVRSRSYSRLFFLIDAFSLGAYAVFGMSRALAHGLGPLAVILVGLVNAVGGGLLRDLLMGREPSLFQPAALEGVAAFIGCLGFVGLTAWSPLGMQTHAWLTIALVFVVRALAVRFDIRTTPLASLMEKREDRDGPS